jgi:hypothetical protein
MQTFVRACEIWVPSKYRSELEYHSGLYGEPGSALQAFRAVSERMCFGYDEGLPGHAWAARAPIVLKDLQHSYFKRADAARAAGLTCGIAIPVFAGEYLLAVAVLYCGDDAEHFGAIELWRTQGNAGREGEEGLTLLDGYYGSAKEFEAASRGAHFKPGAGLPGLAGASNMPEVMGDLWFDKRFARRAGGAPLGLSKGLAIPLPVSGGAPYVMTFLSALGSPVARRFEIWAFDQGDMRGGKRNSGRNSRGNPEAMVFSSGECDLNKAFPQDYMSARIERGFGPIGRVWASGLPEVSEAIAHDPSVNGRSARRAGLTSLLALPVLEDGCIKAVVGLYF